MFEVQMMYSFHPIMYQPSKLQQITKALEDRESHLHQIKDASELLEDLLRVSQQYQTTRNAKRALQQSLQHACLQHRTKMVLRGFQSARLIAPRFCLKPVLLELIRVHFPLSPSQTYSPLSHHPLPQLSTAPYSC